MSSKELQELDRRRAELDASDPDQVESYVGDRLAQAMQQMERDQARDFWLALLVGFILAVIIVVACYGSALLIKAIIAVVPYVP